MNLAEKLGFIKKLDVEVNIVTAAVLPTYKASGCQEINFLLTTE